jgi:hypothetical protein
MARTVLVLLVMLLAGCAAPPAPSQPAAGEPDEPALPPAEASGPSGAAKAVDAGAAAAKKAVERVPLAYHGTTETEACPAVGDTEVCQSAAAGENNPQELPADRRILGMEGEVRWTPATPALTELSVVLQRREAEAWVSMADEGFAVLGGSPLAFQWDLHAFATGIHFRLGVFQGAEVNRYPAAVVYAGTPQEFEVEGALAVARAPLGS